MAKPSKEQTEIAKKNSSHEAGKKSGRDPNLPAPPDGGYGWVVVVAAFMINVIVDGIAYSYGIFIAELQSFYDSDAGITSMVGSLLNGMYLVSSPLASYLIGRFDSRYVTLCGSVISTTGFFLSQFAPSIDVLMITYGLIGGFGMGLMYLPAVVSVSFYFEKRRALTTGIVVCGTGVGCFVFAPLFEASMSSFGWKYSMVLVACITLQAAIFGSLLRPLAPLTRKGAKSSKNEAARKQPVSETNKQDGNNISLEVVQEAKKEEEDTDEEREIGDEKKQLNDGENNNYGEKSDFTKAASESSLAVKVHGSMVDVRHVSSATLASSAKGKKSILETTGINMLADPLFFIPILANLIAMLGHYIPFFFIRQRSIEMIGCTEAQAAFLLSIIAVTNTLGRVLMGFLADFKWVNPLLLHNIAITSSGIACILSMFCLNYASTAVFAAYFGLCMATWISLSPIILCELLGLEKLTNSFGLLCFVRGISAFAGPPLAGKVYDLTNDYNNAFHVGGILLFIGGAISFLLHLPFFQRRTYKTRQLQRQKIGEEN